MRSQVTVVSADGTQAQSVVVDLDPATTVEAVFESLDQGVTFATSDPTTVDLAVESAALNPA